MEIVSTTQKKEFRLRSSFLDQYYRQGDPFETLLARSTYLTKYSRSEEEWTDTIRRVVEANISLASSCSETEAEMLFHLFWTGQALPPGRGLWTGGVEGIPADARYNCWYTTLYGIDDWCWGANQLMLGGGVGFGLTSIDQLPPVQTGNARFAAWCVASHPNHDEVNPDPKSFLNGQTPILRVEDSRAGWVEALRSVLTAAFEGRDIIVDVSPVRPRGALIRTFGGIACGPGPLVHLLRSAWNIIRGAQGRKLTSVEALDITNFIGLCIKSGNVRRSALIALGDANDQEFRDAKKDWEKVQSHRHTSNNSLAFQSWEQIKGFDWSALVEDNAVYGEPGILNLPLIWQTDPGARGVNPCFSGETMIAVADGRNAVSIKQLAEEGKDVPVYSMDKLTGKVEIKMGRNPRITGYQKKLLRVWLDDGSYLDTTPNHKFILLDGTMVEAKDLKRGNSLPRFTKALEKVKTGGKDYYLVHCDTNDYGSDRIFEHRLIAKFNQPEGYVSRIFGGKVLVEKTCESCHKNFEVEHAYRERAFCSEACGNQYVNSNADIKAKRLAGMDLTYSSRMKAVRIEQAKICSTLKFELGRNPTRKEWSVACKKENIPSRIGPTLKFGFKHFSEVLEAGGGYNHKVVRVEELVGDHTVYNITVDDHHTVAIVTSTKDKEGENWFSGIFCANCGEQALHDREACNLAEVFPAKFHEGVDPSIAFRLATRYCLRQRLTPLSDPTSHAVGLQNMRVGVGLGGLCDFDWDQQQLRSWFKLCREEATNYAEDLGVASPITVTTVKPSGTISLLNGSSPGIHAPYAPYYIRRTRIAKNDPMAPAMIEAGVPFEDCIYDKSGHTYVFSFPMKAKHTRTTVISETIREQFERQVAVQEAWADNAVSATLSFEESEKGELAGLLKEYVPRLKSTSCLPKSHGYQQAPYETIDRETFETMYEKINHSHKLVRGGEIEIDECAGGVCPVR